MNQNQKIQLTLVIMISVLFLTGVFYSNQWMSGKIDEIQAISSPQDGLMAQENLKKQNAKKIMPHIPKIDPANDPLSPMVKAETPPPKVIKRDPGKKVYDFSEKSVILLQ